MIKRLKSWDGFAIIFLTVWHLIYYLPVSLGQKVFSEGDIILFFIPFKTEFSRALAAGRLPLWTPGIQAGFPLFAEGQVAALYPLNLILHYLLPVPIAISFIILLDMTWISIGMYLLCRSYGLRIMSALLAGFVIGFSGFVIAHLPHVPHLATAAWLPWLLLLQRKYWQARWNNRTGVIWNTLLSVSFALSFFAGFPQFATHNIAAFLLFGLLTPFLKQDRAQKSVRARLSEGLNELPRSALMTFLPIALGVGMAAVQLLPTAELFGLSTRADDVGWNFFTEYSLAPKYLTQFFLPFWQLGRPEAGNMEYWSYLGVVPFLLALIAPVLRRDGRTWVFFILGAFALSLTLGASNPFYQLLYHIPLINRFRVPSRYLLLFTFSFAYLAAVGFEELQTRSGACLRSPRTPYLIASSFGVLIIAVIVLGYHQSQDTWLDASIWLSLVYLLATVGIFVAAKAKRINQTTFAVMVLGLTILDLSTFGSVFMGTLNRMDLVSNLIAFPRTVQAMDQSQPIYRVLANKLPAATPASMRSALLWNFPLLYGKQGVESYLPSLALGRNEKYTANMSLTMRNLMNVRYYLFPLQNSPWADAPDLDSEPEGGLSAALLSHGIAIPPTRATVVRVISYTDQSKDFSDGFPVGEVVLKSDDGKQVTFPIRIGIETADWAYDGLAQIGRVNHTRPRNALSFPAHLNSVGRDFQGHKYVAQYQITEATVPVTITEITVQSFLPSGGLNVENVFLLAEEGKVNALTSLLGLNELVLENRTTTAAVWENRNMSPRAFMVHRAEIVADDLVLPRLREPDFRSDQIALLSDGQPLIGIDSEGTRDQAVIAEYKPERVVVNVKTDREGYLILADTWYPGWEALVDNTHTPLYRADYVFRAVLIQPGEHEVEFVYRPLSFMIGAWVSVLSIAVTIILAMIGRRFL